MKHGELLTLLREAESRVSDASWRLFPACFDGSDSTLTAYATPLSWTWRSAAETLSTWNSRGVMMRLPLFWQLESPLREACDSSGAFIFVNDPGNMPLGAAALRQAGVDTVVTDKDDAATFSAYLREQGVPLPAFLLIEPLATSVSKLPISFEGASVSRELHLFPGVSLFVQCAALSKNKETRFHAADGFTLTVDTQGARVSGSIDALVPLHDYELPFPASTHGTCLCGKEIVNF